MLAADADLPSRAAGLRLWVIAGAGLFAMAPPNVLLPDSNVPVLQLLNWAPSRLLRYQMGRLGPLLVLVTGPAVLIVFADPNHLLGNLGTKTALLGQALLLLIGTAGDSFAHFATLGPRSQAWQEGSAGEWYGRAVEEHGQGISLPRGLVPALFATTRCFTVGLGAILISATGAQANSLILTWAPGLLLVTWVGIRLWRCRPQYDRHFYHTTAFYDEVMGGGALHADGREPIPYDGLYWVPFRWRPPTWASLRQLDRRLPLGRLVALAHAGLWLLCIRGLPPTLITGFLVVLLIAQTATCGLLTRPAVAPRSFQYTQQSIFDWIGTRTFVNLRWLAAHVGSFALVAIFSDTYDFSWVATWTVAHLVFSLGAATLATLAHEGWSRSRSLA